MIMNLSTIAAGFARGTMRGLSLLSLVTTAAVAADHEKPPQILWDLNTLLKAPQFQPAAGFDTSGVRGVFFDGLPWKGKPTRVFAFVGVPDHKPGEKVPAMVLIHGGGGTAFANWVQFWNSRGYAAIAMDPCGSVPRGKYGDWERHERGGPGTAPGGSGRFAHDEPLEDQWAYHAVADAILANSLLRSLPDVDQNRIGLTGISWGGFLACIVASLDDRFRFAAPVYGCGFIGDNSVWLPEFSKMGKENAAKWLRYWDPSQYLPHAKIPFLWFECPTAITLKARRRRRSALLPTMSCETARRWLASPNKAPVGAKCGPPSKRSPPSRRRNSTSPGIPGMGCISGMRVSPTRGHGVNEPGKQSRPISTWRSTK
jgi:hypothetical protein